MPNYLSTQKDVDDVVQGNRLVRHLATAPALRRITVEEVSPGPGWPATPMACNISVSSRGRSTICAGRARWGRTPRPASSTTGCGCMACGGLRVVDASIFPTVTTGQHQCRNDDGGRERGGDDPGGRLSATYVQAQIQDRRAVRDPADGDQVDAGRRHRRAVSRRDAAGGLGDRAPVDLRDRVAQLLAASCCRAGRRRCRRQAPLRAAPACRPRSRS